ncbi:branched-chain amino acid ABC transporter permease [Nocardioides terrisoli]|uniref:branched-chain amino acid ABC transporter permease n=1 Tax=Nocardioides terrisoli TaxID=3388267 RepID=UPI00287B65A5|nr:branched-chain amino acid ABC transporter permease [Nocardioides marmorisolisilvae]
MFANSPTASSSYAFVLALTYAIVILGGNVVTGFLEEVNLAQGGLMAIGAYCATYLEARHMPLLLALVIGTFATACVGAALSFAVVRLTGVYTALLTFSLSYAVPDLILYAANYTGGGNGLATPVDLRLFGAPIGGTTPATIWLVVAVFILCGATFLSLGHGRPGRLMHASKKRAFAASTFGINPRQVKWVSWVASSALCGLGGALYALVVGFIVPGQFTLTLSLYLLVGTLAGGARTAVGALIGGGLVGVLPIVLSGDAGGTEPLLLGLLLLLVILFGTSGIWTRIEEGAVWIAGTWSIRRVREVAVSPPSGTGAARADGKQA